MSTSKLIPPDFKRCQALIRGGSFMTLGPRPWYRCESAPHWLATERRVGNDGQKGAMTVCDDCAKVMVAQRDPETFDLEWLTGKGVA